MTIYIDRSNCIFPQEDADSFQETLPVGIYTVAFSQMIGFYLERSPTIQKAPTKLYGDVITRSERIINTFNDRATHGKNTGVLLTGVKGSGKTMLTKKISEMMMSNGIATILVGGNINENNIDGFIKFMNLFDGRVVILFDEFEKNFDRDTQTKMLTLFDGITAGTKLFLLTVNDEYKLNTFLLNRPGRIYYRFDYHGLETAFVREYLEDNLKNKFAIDGTVDKIERSFRNTFSFDMLQSVVEEMNRYDLSFADAASVLNIDVKDVSYKAELIKGKKVIVSSTIDDIQYFNMYDAKAEQLIAVDYGTHFQMFDAEKDCLVFDPQCAGYTVEVKTVRTSNRTKSFFFDAV